MAAVVFEADLLVVAPHANVSNDAGVGRCRGILGFQALEPLCHVAPETLELLPIGTPDIPELLCGGFPLRSDLHREQAYLFGQLAELELRQVVTQLHVSCHSLGGRRHAGEVGLRSRLSGRVNGGHGERADQWETSSGDEEYGDGDGQAVDGGGAGRNNGAGMKAIIYAGVVAQVASSALLMGTRRDTM